MKTILKLLWASICVLVLVIYLVCCLTPFISPETFSFITFFALLFPYAFLAALFCVCTLFFVNKKTALIVICLIFVAGYKNLLNAVAFGSTRWQVAKKPGNLRIMTWNVEDFVSDYDLSQPEAKPREGILNAISTYNPDVICFQEYSDTRNSSMKLYVSARDELDSIGYKYYFVSNDSVITKWHPVVLTRGVAIFSRRPFTDSGKINLVHTGVNENLVYADFLCGSKPVRIFTAHLMSFSLFPDTTAADKDVYQATLRRKHSVESKLREVELRHEGEVKKIRQQINKSPYPVIYCGDINTTPASYNYNYLRGDLQDAFLEKGAGLGCTFYKLLKTLRIDVCLPDKRLKVVQCTVPQLYLSDHFPVVADVAWR